MASSSNSIARQSRKPPRNGGRAHQRNDVRNEEPKYDGPKTFCSDTWFTATNPNLEKAMFRHAKDMVPEGEDRSCIKITKHGNTYRARAYSTRSKEEARRWLEDFMSRCVYLTYEPVVMDCVSNKMYDTVRDFVMQGRKDRDNATLFANRIGNYKVSMNLRDGRVLISAWVPLSYVSEAAELKMEQICVALLETLRDLDGIADFAAIMRRLDPEIMKIEAHKAAEYQAKQEQTRREQEQQARFEMQQAAAERIAARSAAQTASATNQFAPLPVDVENEEEEEEAKPKQATWATKVAKAPTQQRVQDQRGERVQGQRGERRSEDQRVRVQEQRVRVQGQRVERRPMEETDCRYGSTCYNKSNGKCGFRHPQEQARAVQEQRERVQEQRERVQEHVVIAFPQRTVVDDVFVGMPSRQPSRSTADAAWEDEEKTSDEPKAVVVASSAAQDVDDWEKLF